MLQQNEALRGSGQQKIKWAQANMPILAQIKARFEKEKPFAGLKIGICLHVEGKTGVWLDALKAGGAEIAITGSPGTTQNDTASELNAWDGITVFGHRDESFEDHIKYCKEVLATKPDLISDNGADLHQLIAEEDEFKPLQDSLLGATEETTTGGFRLREDLTPFDFATFIINDTQAKQIVENRYGVGSSVVDGLMRATNVMLHGKVIVVIGYGFCGSGVAMRLRGMGARVLVVDRDPMRRLEAHMEGFDTAPLDEALPRAEMVVTVTGRSQVLDREMIKLLPDGCILANAGHFATEIDLPSMREMASSITPIRDQIEEIRFSDNRAIFLISLGNLVNLAAGEGNPIEIMDLGLALQALSLERLALKARQLTAGADRVPLDIEKNVAELALSAWAK